MKTITEIKAQRNNPKRCNIYLDGSFFCGLELETVMKNRLKVGAEIDELRLMEIQAESETSVALNKALNFISRSKKTEKQIEDYLKSKGYRENTVKAVTEKMKNYSFIDDYDYAESYLKSYSDKKGKRLLALELKKRGVDERTIEEALNGVEDETEEEACSAIAEKYLKNKTIDKPTIMKCYKYLLGKGFSYDSAKSAVEKYEDEDFQV